MGYKPPGLRDRPDDVALAGFGSLMPTPPKKPGLISRIVKAPVKVVGLPFKLARGVFRLPKRLFRRSKADDA